jgi:hypothetical protein
MSLFSIATTSAVSFVPASRGIESAPGLPALSPSVSYSFPNASNDLQKSLLSVGSDG